MLFSNIYAFALLALSTAVLGGKEHCIVPPVSCYFVTSADYCNSLISKNALARPTCTSPPSTVVQTTTTRATNWKTITTTRTITVTKPTSAVVTRTGVTTRVTTRTFTSTRWRSTKTTTRTISTTTRLPSQTCLARRELDVRQATPFPESCSCYLTSTRKTGVYTILLTSFLLPNATSTATITKTTTTTRVTTTRTVTSVLTRTTVRTSSITIWRTSSTTTTTRTATATFAAACTSPLRISAQLTSSNLESAKAVKVKDFKDCCNRCFAKRGCNSYEYQDSNKDCVLRTWKQSVGCSTGFCPSGRRSLSRGSGSTVKAWGYGPCAST
ncbi:hypothetical protein TWF481_008724 [Arthrobotrys musiformis]|uniref:Apple domain-containing protein n=1 Tax=Arthrobotrys musiformis TaxID=47236 RepID=A0AAV9W8Z6_9PEZI